MADQGEKPRNIFAGGWHNPETGDVLDSGTAMMMDPNEIKKKGYVKGVPKEVAENYLRAGTRRTTTTLGKGLTGRVLGGANNNDDGDEDDQGFELS